MNDPKISIPDFEQRIARLYDEGVLTKEFLATVASALDQAAEQVLGEVEKPGKV
jgi:hypothetical protein